MEKKKNQTKGGEESRKRRESRLRFSVVSVIEKDEMINRKHWPFILFIYIFLFIYLFLYVFFLFFFLSDVKEERRLFFILQWTPFLSVTILFNSLSRVSESSILSPPRPPWKLPSESSAASPSTAKTSANGESCSLSRNWMSSFRPRRWVKIEKLLWDFDVFLFFSFLLLIWICCEDCRLRPWVLGFGRGLLD